MNNWNCLLFSRADDFDIEARRREGVIAITSVIMREALILSITIVVVVVLLPSSATPAREIVLDDGEFSRLCMSFGDQQHIPGKWARLLNGIFQGFYHLL